MAENLRKEVQAELTSLQKNVSQMGSALSIVKQAERIATESSQEFQRLLNESKQQHDHSSSNLEKTLARQELLVQQFTEVSQKLIELSKKLEGTDVSKKLDSLEKLLGKHESILGSIVSEQKSSATQQNQSKSEIASKVSSLQQTISIQLIQLGSDMKINIESEAAKINNAIFAHQKKTFDELRSVHNNALEDRKKAEERLNQISSDLTFQRNMSYSLIGGVAALILYELVGLLL